MKRFTRQEIRDNFRAVSAQGHPVIITAAGRGMFAYFAEQGGADMLAFYQGAYLRVDGIPTIAASMHVGDANGLNLDMGERLYNVTTSTPVMAGVLCNEGSRNMVSYLDKLKELGYSAIMNFPSIGWSKFNEGRRISEDMGVGLRSEMELMDIAAEKDMFVCGVPFTMDDALTLAESKCDAIIYHLGMTNADKEQPLEDACEKIREVTEKVHGVRADIMMFATGGPLTSVEAVEYMFKNTELTGFLADELMDTLLVSELMANVVREFKNQTLQ